MGRPPRLSREMGEAEGSDPESDKKTKFLRKMTVNELKPQIMLQVFFL